MSRRDFLKAGAAGLAVIAGCAPAVRAPPARAPQDTRLRRDFPASFRSEYGNLRESRLIRLAGAEIPVLFIQSTISALDEAARPNRHEVNPEPGKYGQMLTVERVAFQSYNWDTLGSEERHRLLAILPDQNDGIAWSLEYGQMVPTAFVNGGYAIEEGIHTMGIYFPGPLDGAHRQKPGQRTLDAMPCSGLVRAATGQEMRRVLALAENRGDHVTFHFLMADESGNPAGRHLGGYLSCGMTFYPRTLEFRGGAALLIERGGRDPVDGGPVPWDTL